MLHQSGTGGQGGGATTVWRRRRDASCSDAHEHARRAELERVSLSVLQIEVEWCASSPMQAETVLQGGARHLKLDG